MKPHALTLGLRQLPRGSRGRGDRTTPPSHGRVRVPLVTVFMKHIGRALALAGFALLMGCANGDYEYGGRRFSSYEEARAYAGTYDDHLVASVQPLPAPIAGPVIVISPPWAQWQDAMRRVFPWQDDNFTGEMAKLYGEQSSIRAIERRNIFESLERKKARNAEGTQVPPGGYLILYQMQDLPKGFHVDVYIIASGQQERTNVSVGARPVSDERAATERLVQEIEKYVRTHPAGAARRTSAPALDS